MPLNLFEATMLARFGGHKAGLHETGWISDRVETG